MLGAQAGQQEEKWQQEVEGTWDRETIHVAGSVLKGKTSRWVMTFRELRDLKFQSGLTNSRGTIQVLQTWSQKNYCTYHAERSHISILVGQSVNSRYQSVQLVFLWKSWFIGIEKEISWDETSCWSAAIRFRTNLWFQQERQTKKLPLSTDKEA